MHKCYKWVPTNQGKGYNMDKFFDATEVANIFKVKVETIYQWNFYGKIKSVKVNGRLLFKLEDIMNMVA